MVDVLFSFLLFRFDVSMASILFSMRCVRCRRVEVRAADDEGKDSNQISVLSEIYKGRMLGPKKMSKI